ncbi:MAG: adenylyl cyclase, partial [Xanthomonadales bacterium]|nr:adenylyl cyclase [Xanthomonadales bacterium]
MSFFNELKRRNVIRVGFTYAVVGWVIAQVADLALESFGAPDWVMKTLLFLMFIGFIIALFISWAYELTPEGIKKAEDVDPDQSITHETGRKLDRLVIIILLLAVGILVGERFLIDKPTVVQTADQSMPPALPESKPEATPDEEPSIAVLPFVNMSSDPEQEFFSDGISEEILNVLSRIPNLKVAARTSSFQFKGQNLDIADVGKQLQVNHVLEGSVRKAGNTLRITAQLIEVENGFHLWSETFDRQLEDVFAIQDEIAAAIASELRARLTTELDQNSTVINIDAYEFYLKGRGLVARRKHTELYDGIANLNAALEIEPEYAPALATLAKAYVVLPWFSSQMPVGEARELARESAEKALDIDPANVEALAVLAIVYNEVDYNPKGAISLLEKAIEINPGNVAANNFLGDIYLRTGDLKNAMKYESRAAELDPLGAVQLTDLANIHMMRGEYDKVIELSNRALALDSKFSHA